MVSLVLLAVGVLAFCTWYFVIRDPKASRARAEARWFQERIQEFRQHTRTLEEHSDEYCSVFSNEEWIKLNSTLERLESVEQTVRKLMAKKNFSQAIMILDRVNNPLDATSPLDQVDQEIQHIEELINWERSVHGMLKKVVLNLEVAATETRKLTKAPPMMRPRPTLTTLADIKKVLLEDEELRKLSS